MLCLMLWHRTHLLKILNICLVYISHVSRLSQNILGANGNLLHYCFVIHVVLQHTLQQEVSHVRVSRCYSIVCLFGLDDELEYPHPRDCVLRALFLPLLKHLQESITPFLVHQEFTDTSLVPDYLLQTLEYVSE